MTSGSEITFVVLLRLRPPLEHLEHPVGDEPAADDVRGREHHRHEADGLRERVVGEAEDDDRAHDDDAVDEVRPRHQRRVQHRRHLRDHLEAEERREHEDRQLDDEREVGHAARLRSRDAGAARDLVVPVERQLPVGGEMLRGARRRSASRAGSRGRPSARGGSSCRSIVTPRVLDDLAGHGELAVAAGLGGEVDDHRAGAHPLDRARGDELRRRPARHGGGGDDDVEVRDALLERRLLLRLLARASAPSRSRPRSPRCARRDRGTPRRGSPPAPATAGRTSKRRDDRAEPPRGRDRLQAGDACADHERPDGRDRAGGGHQHGEEARDAVGGEQHRLVARRRWPATRARPSTGRA